MGPAAWKGGAGKNIPAGPVECGSRLSCEGYKAWKSGRAEGLRETRRLLSVSRESGDPVVRHSCVPSTWILSCHFYALLHTERHSLTKRRLGSEDSSWGQVAR